MLRASRVIRRHEMATRIAIDTITLDREARYRRRITMTTDRGCEFLLDLPEATYLANGDALEIEGRGLIKVVAAAEDLLEIHARDASLLASSDAHAASDALALARIAWHIGNRHTPAEIGNDAIYIQPDHVLEEMVIGLGAHVHRVKRPFEPEGGAYGGKGPLRKGHGHAHGGGHAHSHEQGHGADHHHDHDHAHGHVQMPRRKPAVWRPE